MAKQGGLGRGLGALIIKTDDVAQTDDLSNSRMPAASAKANASRVSSSDGSNLGSGMEAGESHIRDISVGTILPNPHQPRSLFAPEALEELSASIREHGIIQPLIVTIPDEPLASEQYWLVAGERRWRAAQMAGLATVPAIVREASTSQLMEWALVENIQRADLNALEEAAAFQAMMDALELTQAEVAERIGKSRSAVANTLRLQQLPTKAQAALVEGRISAGHARSLLGLPEKRVMLTALEMILAQDLNVRQTESLIKKLLDPVEDELVEPNSGSQQMNVHLAHLEDRFRMALNTRVSLNRQPDGTGKLVIHFYNDDDLDSIYQHIAGPEDNL